MQNEIDQGITRLMAFPIDGKGPSGMTPPSLLL